MKHFFLADDLLGSDEIIFTNDDYHYLKNVLRLKQGSTLTAIDNKGRLYQLTITKELAGKLAAHYCFIKQADNDKQDIVLYQGLLKGSKLDSIVRQVTEAGVTSIVPVISRYTIVKMDGKDEGNKVERWRRIAREAVQQSGRVSLPEIGNPVALQSLKGIEGTTFFFHQEPVAGKSLHQYLFDCSEKINILIGPEGGFAQEEISWLLASGFLPVFLGDTVLRADTAAIYAIAAIKTILLEKKDWRLI